jgi:hypothetical protein
VFEHGRGAATFYGVRPEQLYDLLTEEIGLNISVMSDWLEGRGPIGRDELVEQFVNNVNYYFLAHP